MGPVRRAAGRKRRRQPKATGSRVALKVAAVDVDGVGRGSGEGVEGDADGQDDLQGGGVHGDAEGLPGGDPVLDEEVGVLEVAEDAEVDGEPDTHSHRFFRALSGAS